MVDFLTAFKITMATEYGFNPGKGESLTINGIDYSQNPDWKGWPIVRQVLAGQPGLTPHQYNSIFDGMPELQAMIQAFFKACYWNTLSLDSIFDQQVANALYDGAVNPCLIGVGKAAQIACNVINHNALVVDGKFGPHSISVVNQMHPILFVTAFNAVRHADYYERVRLTPNDAMWLPSWTARCKPYLSN